MATAINQTTMASVIDTNDIYLSGRYTFAFSDMMRIAEKLKIF
jgi:hypothetical protein